MSNIIQLARRCPPPPSPSVAWSRAQETTMHNSASMQAGNNLSPDLFASVFAGSHGGEMNQHLFTSRAALKLAQFAQTVFDVAVGLFIALFILFLFASPFIAAFCLLFLSVH